MIQSWESHFRDIMAIALKACTRDVSSQRRAVPWLLALLRHGSKLCAPENEIVMCWVQDKCCLQDSREIERADEWYRFLSMQHALAAAKHYRRINLSWERSNLLLHLTWLKDSFQGPSIHENTTCAKEADAIGSGSNSAKSTEGGAPSSSSRVCTTCANELTGHLSRRLSRIVCTYSSGNKWSCTHALSDFELLFLNLSSIVWDLQEKQWIGCVWLGEWIKRHDKQSDKTLCRM